MDISRSSSSCCSSLMGKRRRFENDSDDGGLNLASQSDHKGLQQRTHDGEYHSTGNLMAQEMNKLSVQERERVYEEVHGVADTMEETPESIATSIQKMKEALENVSRQNRRALDRAFFLRPSWEDDQSLYLLFLRSERFDAIQAARKMCRHFQHKMLLFGEDQLIRNITLADLTDKERGYIQKGIYQFLPTQDQSGRLVHLTSVTQYDYNDWKSTMRYFWYQKMTALEDEDVQRRGIVEVVSLHGPYSCSVGKVLAFLKNCQPFLNDWPLRVCSFHLLYDNDTMKSVLELLHMVMGKNIRVRERIHFGSKLESQYTLMSYGIRVAPSLNPGEGWLSPHAMEAYLQERQEKEEAYERAMLKRREEDPEHLLLYPSPRCVLMKHSGRNWMGNIQMNALVQQYSDRYRQTKGRLEKTMMAMEIVQRTQLDGGHFIQREPKGWRVVDDALAKEKVSQALRAAMVKQEQQESNQQEQVASTTCNNNNNNMNMKWMSITDMTISSSNTKRRRMF